MPSLAGVALRNVVRSPRRSLMVALAVAGGCASLIFMTGSNLGVCEMMLSHSVGLMLGHGQIVAANGDALMPAEPALAAAAAVPGLVGAAPRLEVPVLLGRAGHSLGAVLLGIDAPREGRVSSLHRLIAQGALPGPGEADAVALGSDLAARLGVAPGGRVPVSYLDGLDGFAHTRLRVVGIVRTGVEDLDQRLAVVALPTAQRLLDAELPGAVNRILLRAPSNAAADLMTTQVAAVVDPRVYVVRPWHRVSPFLRGLLSFQKGSLNVVLFVMYLVVGAAVAAVQLMGILERTREFGVLASLGYTPARLVALVTLETALVGSLAVALGVAGGAGLVLVINHFGGLDTHITGAENLEGLLGIDPFLRPVLTLAVLARAAGTIVPVLLLGGILPALRAARMTPLQAMRRE